MDIKVSQTLPRKPSIRLRTKNYKKTEPYYCEKCNQVWQYQNDGRWGSAYLRDFPRIGCVTNICKGCR